jgi:hypothetical protein
MDARAEHPQPQGRDMETALEEYKTLREETLKRVEFRYQIFNLTLIVAGSLLTVGTGTNAPRSVLLLYPTLSFFLAAAFVYNSILLVEIGAYIREHLEERLDLRWAHYLKPRYRGIEPFEILSTYGLFLGTQILSLVAYFSFEALPTTVSRVLFGFAVVAVVFTLGALLYPIVYHRRVLREGAPPPGE